MPTCCIHNQLLRYRTLDTSGAPYSAIRIGSCVVEGALGNRFEYEVDVDDPRSRTTYCISFCGVVILLDCY